MKKLLLSLIGLVIVLSIGFVTYTKYPPVQYASAVASSTTFSTAGATTWTAPPGVFWLTVEVWGGGGSGGGATLNTSNGGGGGGGGTYANSSLSVTPGTTYNLTIGATTVGTTGNGASGTPSFITIGSTTVNAQGGGPGIGNNGAGGFGSTASSTGQILKAGGNGLTGTTSQGGGGGGGAGNSGVGGNASGTNGGSGTADNPGGGGGAAKTARGTGNTGTQAGGGGGGAFADTNTDQTGGTGAAGEIILLYDVPNASKSTENQVLIKGITKIQNGKIIITGR